VKWFLTHQAGLPALHESSSPELLYNWTEVIRRLEKEKPWWVPGSMQGEHALFFGHLVGELLRRILRKNLGEMIRTELRARYQIDCYIGVPVFEYIRCADLVGFSHNFRRRYLNNENSLLYKALNNPPSLFEEKIVNSEKWRSAEIPSVNGHATVEALARFFGSLALAKSCGECLGLSSELVSEATLVHSSGIDQVIQRERNWGLGFQIFSKGSFGARGLGGFFGLGNFDAEVGFAFVTRTMCDFSIAESIAAALEQSLKCKLL
jgi:CubicO group peptidase (beta-lactamase class C family)